jgi:hypothetical protein
MGGSFLFYYSDLMPLYYIFRKFSDTIVANYLNYIINKEKIYVDNESSVIRMI